MYQDHESGTLRGMLVLLVIGGLMVLGILGFVLLGNADRARKKAESNADQILDASFDGRSDVTVSVNLTTLKYETFVAGAKQRGYKLVHQADNQYGPHTLIFEKV